MRSASRTFREEFLDLGNKLADPLVFNRRLTEWLVEYNFHRTHAALGYRCPIQLLENTSRVLPMYPSCTGTCHTAWISRILLSGNAPPSSTMTASRSQRRKQRIKALVDLYESQYRGMSRGELLRANRPLYARMLRSGAIRIVPRKRRLLDNPLREYERRYSGLSPGEVYAIDSGLYSTLRIGGLLGALPRKKRRIGDPLAFYRAHYPDMSRGALRKCDESLHVLLRRSGQLRHVRA